MADESKENATVVPLSKAIKWVPWDGSGHARDSSPEHTVYVNGKRQADGATTVMRGWVHNCGWKPGFAWKKGTYVAHREGKAQICKHAQYLTVDPKLARVGWVKWQGQTPARNYAPRFAVDASEGKKIFVARSHNPGPKVGFPNNTGCEVAHGDHRSVINRDAFDYLVVYPVATLELKDVSWNLSEAKTVKDELVSLHTVKVVNGDSASMTLSDTRSESVRVNYSSSTTKELSRAHVTSYSFSVKVRAGTPLYGVSATAGTNTQSSTGSRESRSFATQQDKTHTTTRSVVFKSDKLTRGDDYQVTATCRESVKQIPFSATEVKTFADGTTETTPATGVAFHCVHTEYEVHWNKRG